MRPLKCTGEKGECCIPGRAVLLQGGPKEMEACPENLLLLNQQTLLGQLEEQTPLLTMPYCLQCCHIADKLKF